jgi:hypothetical protein
MLVSVVLLPGCSPEKAASATPQRAALQPASSTGATAGHFSLNTPVDKIAANPDGKAVLNRDMPGLISNPSYVLFSDMSLSQLASLSGGRLNKATLDQVEADLSQLPIDSKLAQ